MNQFLAYVPRQSPIHRLDARIKLFLLLVYSIALFCFQTWWGIGLAAALMLVVMGLSRVPVRNYARALLPALMILIFIWICNSLAFSGTFSETIAISDPESLSVTIGVGSGIFDWLSVLKGVLIASGGIDFLTYGLKPQNLLGTVYFNPAGSLISLAYVARILLIILASFAITFTTTSTQLTDALSALLRPLRKLKMPVDEIAFTLSLGVRFIPLLVEELGSIKQAQMARGAAFETGKIWSRFKAWIVVFVPLFVGFFRRANTVAQAMDARCFGAGARSHLGALKLSISGWVTLIFGAILGLILMLIF